MEIIMGTCQICNKSFETKVTGRTKKYCSEKCKTKAKGRKPKERTCKTCNNIITQKGKHYCSESCYPKTKRGVNKELTQKRTIWTNDGKKICIDCGIAKDTGDFKSNGNKLRSECRECSIKRSRKRERKAIHHFVCKHCEKPASHYHKKYTTFCSRECAFAHAQGKEKYEPLLCERCGVPKGKYGSYRYCVPCTEIVKKEQELEALTKQAELEQARKLREEEQEKERLRKKAEREAEKEIRRIKIENSLNKTCTTCNKPYRAKMTKQKHCAKCRMERELTRDIIRGRRSKACLPLNIERFDEDITLEKLFERDKGICYLCGITCNWNDRENINGHRVTGATYPTREHVIALSLGGTHTWDNVRLACFDCNTKKHNKDISENEGQLQFYI